MGRAPCCDKANVKKGPWSPEEDATLKAYIEKNGTGGNWIALPQKIGLKRCGKSCRLRWLNYLRPNIRHGSFSEEEDSIICSLYTNIGSRWSIIAAQLPGRTDNDIKNYWNTRLKKRLLGPSPPSSSRARRIAMATEVPSQSSTPFAGTDSSGNGLNTSNRHDTVRPNGVAAAVTLDDGFLQVNQQALIWSANSTTCPQIQDFASQTPSPSLLPVLTAEPNLNTEGEEQAAIRRILMILDGRIGSNCTLPIYTAPIDIADGDRVTAPTFDGAFAFDAASSPSSSNANAVASYSSLLASMMQQQQQQQIECSIPCYPVQIDVTTEGEFDGLCGAMSSILDDGASASTTSSSESNGGACWNAVSDPLLTYPPLSDLLRAECAMHQQPQRSSMNQYQLVHPATETR